MVVSYALRSATASGVRPGSSRRLWRACIASHTASQRLPPAKSLGHALRQTLSCMSIRGWARLDSPCAWGCHRRSQCSRSDRRGTQLRSAGTPSKVHSSTSMPFGHGWNLFTVVSLPSTAAFKIVLRLITKFQLANTPVVFGLTRGYLDCSGVVAGWISAHTRCSAYIPTIETRGLPYRGT